MRRRNFGGLLIASLMTACASGVAGERGCSPEGCAGDSGTKTDGGQGGEVALGPSQSGIATFYDATGAGSCSYDATPEDLRVAAMNAPQFHGSAACGECVHVVGPSGAVTVRIVDLCPGCQSGHLDLSREAFAQIANQSLGRVNITWTPVSCVIQGPLSYRMKDGSSQWWTAIQVLHHRLPIRSVEWEHAGSWVPIRREAYNYFVVDHGVGPQPFRLRVTASDGQQLIDSLPPVVDGAVVAGTSQFGP